MVAPECLTDLGQGQIGEFAAQIHRDLAGLGQRTRLARPSQFVDAGLEVLRGGGHDGRGADLHRGGVGDEIAQHDLGQRLVDGGLVQRRERGDPDERALEFADVALDAAGDQLQDITGHVEAVHLSLLAQNGDPRFQLRRLDIGDEAPFEAGAQPVLEGGQLLRRPVGGDDDLLVRVVQGVERVEELFLDAVFALDELDVVDEQDVDVAVGAFERRSTVIAQRVDEVVGEFLGRDVLDPHPREQSLGVIAGRVQEVGLTQTRLAPDEQRVVGPGGRFGDRQ